MASVQGRGPCFCNDLPFIAGRKWHPPSSSPCTARGYGKPVPGHRVPALSHLAQPTPSPGTSTAHTHISSKAGLNLAWLLSSAQRGRAHKSTPPRKICFPALFAPRCTTRIWLRRIVSPAAAPARDQNKAGPRRAQARSPFGSVRCVSKSTRVIERKSDLLDSNNRKGIKRFGMEVNCNGFFATSRVA